MWDTMVCQSLTPSTLGGSTQEQAVSRTFGSAVSLNSQNHCTAGGFTSLSVIRVSLQSYVVGLQGEKLVAVSILGFSCVGCDLLSLKTSVCGMKQRPVKAGD